MNRVILAVVTALVIGLIGGRAASAQNFGIAAGGCYPNPGCGYYGGCGYGSYSGYGGYGGYWAGYSSGYDPFRVHAGGIGFGGSGIGLNVGFGQPAVWHNTTHLDYHPGGYVPHRGHLDYIPGHYDVHRTGHWDW